MVIYLRSYLLSDRPFFQLSSNEQFEMEDILGLAPDGVYHATGTYDPARCALTTPFHPYSSTSSERFVFCCTFRCISTPCFHRHPALWCPDFPYPKLYYGTRPSNQLFILLNRNYVSFSSKEYIKILLHVSHCTIESLLFNSESFWDGSIVKHPPQ